MLFLFFLFIGSVFFDAFASSRIKICIVKGWKLDFFGSFGSLLFLFFLFIGSVFLMHSLLPGSRFVYIIGWKLDFFWFVWKFVILIFLIYWIVWDSNKGAGNENAVLILFYGVLKYWCVSGSCYIDLNQLFFRTIARETDG